jgi:multiple sugar transport system permease protein
VTTTTGRPAPLVELGAQSMRARRRAAAKGSRASRSAISDVEWRRRRTRIPWQVMHAVMLALLAVACIGPLLLLLKFAITPTQDILSTPLKVFPHGVAWSNLSEAWNDVQISRYFVNSLVLAAGSWASQLIVATSAGYVLSVLRPRWSRVLNGAILITLFVPAVVLLVPVYLVVLNPPIIGHSLVNSFWAVWLPAGASAFNVVLMTRFFDNLPREIFEAARVDGAGPVRLFWSVVLPMSKPILGVVSVFAVIASWKDFLWPLLVLRDPDLQPLSVRLPSLQATTDMGVLMAALAIATLLPVVLFLVFQRMFLSGAGMSGAVKG